MSSVTPSEFQAGQLYAIADIQNALGVGNAGGVRLCTSDKGATRRVVVLTSPASAKQARENPHHDRIENGVLVYTGAGLEGDQSLSGMNKRLPQQSLESFPIYGFTLIGSRRDRSIGPRRWRFLGLLEYLRHYPDTQVDTRGNARKVWLFEFRIHEKPNVVPVELDTNLSVKLIEQSRSLYPTQKDEREVVVLASLPNSEKKDAAVIEAARARLLASSPEEFEHFVKDLLARSGFDKAAVTRFSQDGGIDVNAYAGASMWPLQGTLIQIQAKRWLHTVGRKEVAELRGSLLPHARGALVTTSYFSKAALLEAAESGKLPIVLVDGNEVARLSLEFGSKT